MKCVRRSFASQLSNRLPDTLMTATAEVNQRRRLRRAERLRLAEENYKQLIADRKAKRAQDARTKKQFSKEGRRFYNKGD